METGAIHLSGRAQTSRAVHHATKVIVPVDGARITVATGTSSIHTDLPVVVAPGVSNVAACDGPTTTFFFDPVAFEGRLRHLVEGVEPIDGRKGQALIALAAAAGPPSALHAEAAAFLRPLAGPPVRLDRRVRRTLEALREGRRVGGALARDVGLSDRRLRHLFRAQVGLSMQRASLWYRLVRAYGALLEGQPAAAAAAAAGFADQAHFARTSRTFGGQPPSYVRGR